MRTAKTMTLRFASKAILATTALLMSGCGGKSALDGFQPTSGNLWSGVIIYTRDKAPAFGVIGGNDNHPFPDGPARGIKVHYPDGREEWKNRDSLVKAEGYYFVKDDDPALAAKRWKVLSD